MQARDSPAVRDSLDYVATWNSAQLISEDIKAVLGSLLGTSNNGSKEGGAAAAAGSEEGGERKHKAPAFSKL